jgi:hypothetical protein
LACREGLLLATKRRRLNRARLHCTLYVAARYLLLLFLPFGFDFAGKCRAAHTK